MSRILKIKDVDLDLISQEDEDYLIEELKNSIYEYEIIIK